MTADDPRSGPLMAMVGSMAMEGYKIGDAGGARSSGVRALAAYGPPGREPIIVSGSGALSVVRSASDAWAAAAGKLWEGGGPCWGPDFMDVVIASLGLKVRRGAREKIEPVTARWKELYGA